MYITKKRFEEKFSGYIELIYCNRVPETLHQYADQFNLENEEEYTQLTSLVSNFFNYHKDKVQEIIHTRLCEVLNYYVTPEMVPINEIRKIFYMVEQELLPIIYSKFHFL